MPLSVIHPICDQPEGIAVAIPGEADEVVDVVDEAVVDDALLDDAVEGDTDVERGVLEA